MAIFREASPGDETAIATLIQDLAQSMGETSPIAPDFVSTYLAFPGCHILLAVEHGQIVGLLSYSIRPNLYHSGDTALIEELIVRSTWRGQGVGGVLLEALLARLKESGCVEVSVTTLPDNQGAIRFYRTHGLMDEALYLEKHL